MLKSPFGSSFKLDSIRRGFLSFIQKKIIEKALHIFEKQHIYPFVFCLPQKKKKCFCLLPKLMLCCTFHTSGGWSKAAWQEAVPEEKNECMTGRDVTQQGDETPQRQCPSFWQQKVLILGCASFMTRFENFSVICSSFQGIHWHTLWVRKHLSGELRLIIQGFLNYLPVRLTLRHFHGTLHNL